MVTQTLGWGIAGYGWVARDFVAPAIATSANGRLVALHDLDASALPPSPHATSSLEAFLATPGLGAVYVATPNHAHRPVVEAAARAGLPVMCEKPMAADLDDAHAMVEACRSSGIVYATAFDQRFHAAHVHLAQLVKDGLAGVVTAIRIVYACWVDDAWSVDNWRIDPTRAGGGALIDLAPHGLDLASMLLGEELVDIHAFGQGRVHAYARERRVEDGAVISARSETGALVQLHVSYNHPETLPRRRLEIVGTKGMFIAEDTMGQTPGGRVTFLDARTGLSRPIAVPGADRSPFARQVEEFADCVLTGRPFPFTPAHDLHVMTLLDRARRLAAPPLSDGAG